MKIFTVIGACNNYCAYGPDVNGDGEIKLCRQAVSAQNAVEAVVKAQKILREGVELKPECDNDEREHDVLDSAFALDGNPFDLRVNDCAL